MIDYSKRCMIDFIKSFKLGLGHLVVAIYSLLMGILILGANYLVLLGLAYFIPEIPELSLATAGLIASMLRKFSILLILTIIIMFVLTVLIYGIFNALIWAKISKKKIRIRRYIGASFIWMPIWIILFIIMPFIFSQKYLVYIVMIWLMLYVYFSLLYYIELTKKGVFIAFKNMIKLAFIDFPALMFPFALALILFIIVRMPLNYLNINIYAAISINLIIMLAYFSWLRYYIHQIVHDIKKR